MSATTGPILAVGAITLGNAIIVNGKSPVSQTRVIVGTGIAAGLLSLLERAAPELAVALAWVSLVTILLTRVDPNVPSPAESFVKWYNAT